MDGPARELRAGTEIDDSCRVCKELREHTVLAVDPARNIVRVQCDTCGSQHIYRGGDRTGGGGRTSRVSGPSGAATGASEGVVLAGRQLPLVSERERSQPAMADGDYGSGDLEMLLRRIIREEAGLTPAIPADKWRGGDLVLRPGKPGLQEKVIPIESFFHKIVMLRNRLRTLEQQVNGSELSEEAKIKVQGYITGCYGSLTSFNILFAEDEDRFHGSGGE